MKNLSKKKKILIGAVLSVFLILFSVYCVYQNNMLTVTEYEITDKRLPEGFDGFKVVQISDFHNPKGDFLKESVLSETKALEPDIIVLTGDFIDSRRPKPEISLAFAKELVKIAPVYFAPGNHEARIPEIYEPFERELRNIGVRVLRNSCQKISIRGEEINIIGVDDATFYGTEDKYISTARAIDEISYNKNLFTITLSHRPELFSVYTKKEQDLVFSGHLHGGQFVIPFLGGLYMPTEGFFPEYWQGVHTEDDTTMVVSRGIGNSAFPIRINNRPELISVTLRTAE